MSDSAQHNPAGAAQRIADALLRSVSGSSALLRTATPASASAQAELGIAATGASVVEVSPVVLRKLRPDGRAGRRPGWELLVSAASVAQQLGTADLAAAQALFAMALRITVGEQDYFIESVSSNEAFGQVYLYRLLLREARQQSI